MKFNFEIIVWVIFIIFIGALFVNGHQAIVNHQKSVCADYYYEDSITSYKFYLVCENDECREYFIERISKNIKKAEECLK